MKKAIVLLSGGLDSVTTLAYARSKGYDCYALSFNYGQRSQAELNAARYFAKVYDVREHRIVELDFLKNLQSSALTDNNIAVPTETPSDIPVTYVPARNTLFLTMAAAMGEVNGARDIFIGANIIDYSGYPDCRPAFLRAYEEMINLGTKAGSEGDYYHIVAPLIELSKADIIKLGASLNVDYSKTVSCYQASEEGKACGICSSCQERRDDGFKKAGLLDPTPYQAVETI